jgi:glyoxylase-like metal-dependent hydrolase (beta-lactamase superfamily II)/rhodanese-related sulfurtransferase
MILKQIYLACLSQASYFLVDEETKTALVVDPRRDVDVYLEEARRAGATIRHVLLTHCHADFLAGHLELRERTGAKIHLGAKAEAQFAFEPMRDGGELTLGKLRLRFLETPGHTPESVSILVFDLAKDARKPQAVLTGDTLFVGDVGRPDLMASVGITAAELAGQLYDSLHAKLLPLADDVTVYPAHGAGSMCGKNLGPENSSTMGVQRRTNWALQPMTKQEFVRLVTSEQPEAPPYFAYDARLNRAERRTLDQVLKSALKPLGIARLLELQAAGAVVLDTRDADRYAAGHVRGAVNIGLSGKYASWAGTVLPTESSIVIVCDAGKEEESVLRLGRIGYDRIAGFLEGGFEAARARPAAIASHPRWKPAELAARLKSDPTLVVVDVRLPGEWSAGHIDGALHVPLHRLASSLAEVPADRTLVCICKSGYRSSTAASLLEKAGRRAVLDVVGGMDAWTAAKLPALTPTPA